MVDEWETRLINGNFHGGNEPDAADFRMYALVNAHNHMQSVRKCLKARNNYDKKFNAWYTSMVNVCQNKFM